MHLCVFAWISEQTAFISLYSYNLSGFITEAESVYCAVRTGSLNQTDTLSSLQECSQHHNLKPMYVTSGFHSSTALI